MTAIDLRRSMGWLLAVAAAANAAQYILGNYSSLLGPANALMAFEYGRNFVLMGWLAPALCALPYCVGFCMDWKSGFAIPQLLQVGRKRFIKSKLLAAGVSGGAVFALGTLIFFGVCCAFLGLDGYREAFGHLTTGTHAMVHTNLAVYIAGMAGLQFLGGATYALFSLAFSAYHPNPYFALVVPMLVSDLSVLLSARLNLPSYMNIGMLADGAVNLSFAGAMIAGLCVFGALIALCCGLFSLGVRRRIENG